MEDGHAKSWEDVVEYFRVDPDKGLTPDQVKSYQEKYGPNGKQNESGTRVRNSSSSSSKI